jgi:hypothetical protein
MGREDTNVLSANTRAGNNEISLSDMAIDKIN